MIFIHDDGIHVFFSSKIFISNLFKKSKNNIYIMI